LRIDNRRRDSASHPGRNHEPQRHQKTDPQRDGLLPGHQLPAGHRCDPGPGVQRRSGRIEDGNHPSTGPADTFESADGGFGIDINIGC